MDTRDAETSDVRRLNIETSSAQVRRSDPSIVRPFDGLGAHYAGRGCPTLGISNAWERSCSSVANGKRQRKDFSFSFEMTKVNVIFLTQFLEGR